MSKFKLFLPILAGAALVCTFAVQAGAREQAATGTAQLAMSTVATGAAARVATLDQAVNDANAEPSNYMLMAAGLGAIAFVASRRRRRQQF